MKSTSATLFPGSQVCVLAEDNISFIKQPPIDIGTSENEIILDCGEYIDIPYNGKYIRITSGEYTLLRILSIEQLNYKD